jgi:hypothetical protein
MSQAGSKDMTLMGYFKVNAEHPAARDLLYQDMPLKFTWSKSNRTWSPRKDKCKGNLTVLRRILQGKSKVNI